MLATPQFRLYGRIAGTGAVGFLGNAVVVSGDTLDLTPNPLHVTLTPDNAEAVVPAQTPKDMATTGVSK